MIKERKNAPFNKSHSINSSFSSIAILSKMYIRSIYLNNSQQELSTAKTRIKEYVFWGFRLILFLYVGCFLQNQRENVLKVFLKLFL